MKVKEIKKILTVNKYLDIMRSYLVYIIDYHKTQDEWKIHLTAVIKRLVPYAQKVRLFKNFLSLF